MVNRILVKRYINGISESWTKSITYFNEENMEYFLIEIKQLRDRINDLVDIIEGSHHE